MIKLLVVIGASGAGKTAAVHALESRNLPGVQCHYFDSIGVPPLDAMEREWAGGENWQEYATKEWVNRLARSTTPEVCVLEGQTRPSFIEPALAQAGIRQARIVLLDCATEIRRIRLHRDRKQPELANDRMDQWAAYLRGQADARGIRVVDTSELPTEAVADLLEDEVQVLKNRINPV